MNRAWICVSNGVLWCVKSVEISFHIQIIASNTPAAFILTGWQEKNDLPSNWHCSPIEKKFAFGMFIYYYDELRMRTMNCSMIIFWSAQKIYSGLSNTF